MNYGLPAVGSLSTEWPELFIVTGTIALVLLAGFFWAIFIRKDVKRRVRRRKRRRSLNTTLAKSGGLPPIREGKTTGLQTPPP